MREELIDNKELYKNIDTIGEFNLLLEEFNRNYNCYKPHSSIDYLTPMEHYEKCKKTRWVFPKCIELGTINFQTLTFNLHQITITINHI